MQFPIPSCPSLYGERLLPLRLQCPHCQVVCQLDEQVQGGTAKCQKCGKLFGVPLFSLPPVPPAAPQAQLVTCRLNIGSATSAGKVRKRNEDRFLVMHLNWSGPDKYHDVALVIVADGLGGYEGGEKAATMVMSQVGAALGSLLVNLVNSQAGETLDRVDKSIAYALENANRSVFERSQADSACKGMAATVVVAAVLDGEVLIGHVGDCRAYHHRREQLTQVTKDQTLVERMLELGTLTPAEAAHHPARNQVSQAIGKNKTLAPASYRLSMIPGDCLILACDGLHAHVDDRMLAAAIRKNAASADILANHLVELTNQEGGSDNCTVVAMLAY
jgi:serine/threonine protein phosphatase PrpC